MKLHFLTITILLSSSLFSLYGQTFSAIEIIEKSITYHDPNGAWDNNQLTLELLEMRPKGKDRFSTLIIDNSKSKIIINRLKEKDLISRTLEGEKTHTITVNGKITKDEKIINKYKLNKNYSILLRNYYVYLWGLPMKLKDPGTVIHPKVQDTTFLKQAVYGVKVTYDEGVGEDIWYFYFDKTTFALSGYRFYHVETDNDGEYISLQGEVEKDGFRLPQIRKWYTHKEEKYLGADIIMSIK